ncbi:nuclear pore complex protein NUP107 isoform X2 [Spinacia oleracea]|uniref:Nuclear pore complex protein NUP107 isoform X2 n=1 Tax=Spinacia oleracea TaxID=3562 RepID=A0ABM3QNB2_SPIOL|nr:nuclear pore complex protein NUP107-like isoform X2 [Spinacia oleracea]XP_056684862.1 nuclear pore complex protein NUP107-like isoform X2 [Spinacia oleracea]XP_056684865.1 nuclear pore complex protein NUP107-like isoform X2 [Spinacia oleracea]
MAAGFKGEISRFQAGVTKEISRLDAWYSNADGSVKDQAAYIVRGLCRRCCLPELILRCMQMSVSLVELIEVPERHEELIELVACPETGFIRLFSQQQLQEFLLFEREYSICAMELQEERSMSAHEQLYQSQVRIPPPTCVIGLCWSREGEGLSLELHRSSS